MLCVCFLRLTRLEDGAGHKPGALQDRYALVSLPFTGVAFFLQIEGTTVHQQNNYDSLSCDTQFIAMVWNQTCSISELCLSFKCFLPCEAWKVQGGTWGCGMSGHPMSV